ncbi:MAG: DNA methyltransferase [Thermoguttaceae bacterium]
MPYELIHGDCFEELKKLPDCFFDGVLSDPPYALSFMGKEWDSILPPVAVWKELLRVVRPGAFLLIFGGTKTYHRLATNIEDSGFEIRDCLNWLYGQGMPHGKNLGAGYHTALKPAVEMVVPS